jgi:hypothetical protein
MRFFQIQYKPILINFFCIFFFFVSGVFKINAQNLKTKVDTIFKDSVPYKILYDNKIYKLNAGFATLDGGFYTSNHIYYWMKGLAINFNFHFYKELYFQIGLTRIKGYKTLEYPEKKDLTISYFNFNLSPITIKTENTHFAFVFTPIGLAYGGGYKDETYHFVGKIATDSTNVIQNNYFGLNYYSALQCIYKFKYDLGIGASVYAEYQSDATILGFKLCLYFSAAFKGNQTKPNWYYKNNPDKN